MVDDATFCIWRRYSDNNWQTGPVEFPTDSPDPDGSKGLLSILEGEPEAYQAWAAEYYELDIDLAAVKSVYRQEPLTPELVAKLNCELSFAGLIADIEEIDYPGTT
jgi:hypothetical protein